MMRAVCRTLAWLVVLASPGVNAQGFTTPPTRGIASVGWVPSTYSRATPPGVPTPPVTVTSVNCAGAGCVTTNRTLLTAYNTTFASSIPAGLACLKTTGSDASGAVYTGSIPSNAACFATIQACLNSAAGTCTIQDSGDYVPYHWRNDLDAGSGNGTIAKKVVAASGQTPRIRNAGDDLRTATWTQSTTYTNLWSMRVTQGQAGVLRVLRPGSYDSYGFENRVAIYGLNGSNYPWTSATSGQVTTALTNANAAGTGAVYDPNNQLLYVGLGGTSVATVAASGGLRACWLDAAGSSTIYMIGTQLYTSGVKNDCVSFQTQTGGTGGAPKIASLYVSATQVLFGGADSVTIADINAQGGVAYIENSTVAGAFDDNFHCDFDQFTVKGVIVEINNAGFEAGDTASFPNNAANSTPQVSSSHSGCDVIRFGATYEGTATGWQAIADTTSNGVTSYSWNVGVLTNGAPTAGNECAGGTTGTRVCYYDTSQDLAAGAYGVWGTLSGITTKVATLNSVALVRAGVTCDNGATCTTYDPASP